MGHGVPHSGILYQCHSPCCGHKGLSKCAFTLSSVRSSKGTDHTSTVKLLYTSMHIHKYTMAAMRIHCISVVLSTMTNLKKYQLKYDTLLAYRYITEYKKECTLQRLTCFGSYYRTEYENVDNHFINVVYYARRLATHFWLELNKDWAQILFWEPTLL